MKFNAPILHPKKNLPRINPRTGILSAWYCLRNKDGNVSTPLRILKRFRNSSVSMKRTIPERTGTPQAEIQEVVPLYFENETASDANFDTVSGNDVAIRLQLGSIHIEITNCATQNTIQTTLSVLQSLC